MSTVRGNGGPSSPGLSFGSSRLARRILHLSATCSLGGSSLFVLFFLLSWFFGFVIFHIGKLSSWGVGRRHRGQSTSSRTPHSGGVFQGRRGSRHMGGQRFNSTKRRFQVGRMELSHVGRSRRGGSMGGVSWATGNVTGRTGQGYEGGRTNGKGRARRRGRRTRARGLQRLRRSRAYNHGRYVCSYCRGLHFRRSTRHVRRGLYGVVGVLRGPYGQSTHRGTFQGFHRLAFLGHGRRARGGQRRRHRSR